jgi:hypothetical protein
MGCKDRPVQAQQEGLPVRDERQEVGDCLCLCLWGPLFQVAVAPVQWVMAKGHTINRRSSTRWPRRRSVQIV